MSTLLFYVPAEAVWWFCRALQHAALHFVQACQISALPHLEKDTNTHSPQWEKTWILLAEENQEEKLLPEELQNQLDLRQAQLEEKDRQIAYIREEYEKLRQIALKLQEDGRRMKEYIGIKRKKEYPPESGS